jgi:hypothetical protein
MKIEDEADEIKTRATGVTSKWPKGRVRLEEPEVDEEE